MIHTKHAVRDVVTRFCERSPLRDAWHLVADPLRHAIVDSLVVDVVRSARGTRAGDAPAVTLTDDEILDLRDRIVRALAANHFSLQEAEERSRSSGATRRATGAPESTETQQ